MYKTGIVNKVAPIQIIVEPHQVMVIINDNIATNKRILLSKYRGR
jgi:hypothetical protein